MMMGGGGGGGMFHGPPGSGRGIGDRILDEDAFGKAYDHHVVTRFLPYILPHKLLVTVATLSMLAFTGSLVAGPWIIKLGIDGFIETRDLTGLSLVVGLFLLNAAVTFAAGYAQEVTIGMLGQRVLFRLRGDMFRHLQKMSLRFYDKTEVGRIMSRVQGDVYQLQEFAAVAVSTLGEILSLVGIVAALLLLSPKLGLISMTVLPVLVVAMIVWQPFAIKAFLRVRRAMSIVNGALNENITGVRVVQAMNRQDRNLELFDEKNRENYKSGLAASRLTAAVMPPVSFLSSLSIAMAIFFGARMVTSEALEVGTMVAFVMYIQRFFIPVQMLTMQYTQLQRSMASGVRIFQMLDTEPDLIDLQEARDLPRLKGQVDFRNVSYSYEPGQDVLKNVNLHVEPGETVAIVGPTGAGKTTLVSLMSRFYDVERGRGAILVDGQDIRDVTRRSLAGQMSMVLQEPFLFSTTVRENIKYKHEDATDDQMIAAAKAVGAHDFIMRLEDGYDTPLQERGVNLSVGQRQLVSFARAIVADPRILILDEATANIDSYTEMLIQRALDTLLQGRTAIVIAHRLSTIRGADKIVVLDMGEVVEVGTHDQLMDRDGLYSHLYQMNYAAMAD
ncbi:MAG: ABC transporter ATP-binding protein [SAR202 cluster bacterium]|nr:ABC transporter ATP-binding protein [SAR202 cluster bacterium]